MSQLTKKKQNMNMNEYESWRREREEKERRLLELNSELGRKCGEIGGLMELEKFMEELEKTPSNLVSKKLKEGRERLGSLKDHILKEREKLRKEFRETIEFLS